MMMVLVMIVIIHADIVKTLKPIYLILMELINAFNVIPLVISNIIRRRDYRELILMMEI